MPRLTRTGLAPSPIACMPARTIAWASTVAVVVPSPTMSLVLIAASLTSWAPMFSNWFFRKISRAMVTPSLVTTGVPVTFSRMTLRPLGPSVDFTASASLSTPASNKVCASAPKRNSLAIGPPLERSRCHVGYPLTPTNERNGAGSRHEDCPAADPASVQIGDRNDSLVERIERGVVGDLAGLREHHQLGQVDVSADDVADDVALGRDDVERRDVQRAAVANHVIRPGPPGHRPAVVLGALLSDEVEHDLCARPAGQVQDGLHLAAVRHHGVLSAQLLGELQRIRVAVDHDDPGGGQRL